MSVLNTGVIFEVMKRGKRPACDVLHRRVELSRLRTMVGSPVRVCAAAEERADDAGRNCMLLRLRRIQ
jgi:hypothetical protein